MLLSRPAISSEETYRENVSKLTSQEEALTGKKEKENT